MKIALVNESGSREKNKIILSALKDVVEPMGHEVINYGVSEDDPELNLGYVEIAYLNAILLNSGAVDFVVSGCASGEGVCMMSNCYPNVYCGYIKDPTDAYIFGQVNNGNAMSLPYALQFGLGAELNLRYLFRAFFESERGIGYPESRAKIQRQFEKQFKSMKNAVCDDMCAVIQRTDRDVTTKVISGKVFKERFINDATNEKLINILKEYM